MGHILLKSFDASSSSNSGSSAAAAASSSTSSMLELQISESKTTTKGEDEATPTEGESEKPSETEEEDSEDSTPYILDDVYHAHQANSHSPDQIETIKMALSNRNDLMLFTSHRFLKVDN